MMYEYNFLTAAEVSIENAQKKMKKFYIQINLKEKSSDSSSSEDIEKNNFQVVIFFDEKKKNYKSEKSHEFILISRMKYASEFQSVFK